MRFVSWIWRHDMDRIWANRIEAGTKTFSQVPDGRKTAVNALLLQDVEDGRITMEEYEGLIAR